jgi:hypothetical protein
MSILAQVNWSAARRHYDDRVKAHKYLLECLDSALLNKFADAALAVDDPTANYSAYEHGLGPKILATNLNAAKQVFSLGLQFRGLKSARAVPELIRNAAIKNLQIGVGSEMSCLVNPTVCWVANTRTIWTHLVIKNADNVELANEELRYYRDSDSTSKMAYDNWASIHAELDVALTRIAKMGNELAKRAGVIPGELTYLWADAIANEFYDLYHG